MPGRGSKLETSVDQYWSKVCGVIFDVNRSFSNWRNNNVSLAQFGRMPDWWSGDPRFKSRVGEFFSLKYLLMRKWTIRWRTTRTTKTQAIPWSLADGRRQKRTCTSSSITSLTFHYYFAQILKILHQFLKNLPLMFLCLNWQKTSEVEESSFSGFFAEVMLSKICWDNHFLKGLNEPSREILHLSILPTNLHFFQSLKKLTPSRKAFSKNNCCLDSSRISRNIDWIEAQKFIIGR